MKLTRYNGHVPLFSQNMEGRERTLFGSTVQDDDINNQFTPEFLRGWGSVGSTEFPTLQDFNALAYTHNKLLSYLYQAGIPSYSQSEEYYIGSIVQYNKDIYICLIDNPTLLPTDTNTWKRLINVSDMSQEVIDNDLLTVTSGAVYRALELKLDENVYATLTQKGITQLTSTIDDSEDKAITPKAVKTELSGKQSSLSFLGTGKTVNESVLKLNSKSFTTNGHCELPNGLIMQWGLITENITTSFPIAFPNQILAISGTEIALVESSGLIVFGVIAGSLNRTSFIPSVRRENGDGAVSRISVVYMAIGY